MPQYLIAFNDEWVPDLTLDDLRERGERGLAVIAEITAAGVDPTEVPLEEAG